jgi:hypothetical protein
VQVQDKDDEDENTDMEERMTTDQTPCTPHWTSREHRRSPRHAIDLPLVSTQRADR